MPHLVFLFHLLVIALITFQVLFLRLRFPRKTAGPARSKTLDWYLRTLLAGVMVLASTAISEYLFFNVIGLELADYSLSVSGFYQVALARHPGADLILLVTDLLWILGNPALLLFFIPPLTLALLDGSGTAAPGRDSAPGCLGSRLRMILWRVSLVSAIACYTWAALRTLLVLVLLRLGVQTDAWVQGLVTVFQWSYFPVTYGLLAFWAIYGFAHRFWRGDTFLGPFIRLGLGAVVILSCLLTLESLDKYQQVSLPLLTTLFQAARPYGMQIPWILMGWLGVLGLIAMFRAEQAPLSGTLPRACSPDPFVGRGLSEREREIARLIVSGVGNKEIAERLDISYNTVKNHVASIFRKLGVSSRFEMLRFVHKT
jgi:DNA-binding CsgD family transcriptional regulator